MAKKLGRRERKAKTEQAKADSFAAAYAAKHGLSPDEARAELGELTRVHAQVSMELEGTGVVVSDIVFNREENQVVVKVKPMDVSEAEQAQALFDQHALQAARPRIARFELEAALGAPKTSLPFLGLCASATLVS